MKNFSKYSKKEIADAAKLAGDLGAFKYAINNTQEYITNVKSFSVLKEKFPNKIGADIKTWVETQSDQNVLGNFLVGHSKGEVDAMNHLNGSLKGLLYKAEFARNDAGDLLSNSAHDLVVKNRFTDEIVNYVSVKSPWTKNNHSNTVSDIEDWYSKIPDDEKHKALLLGPKNLIEKAQDKLPYLNGANVNSEGINAENIDKMKSLVEANDPSLLGEITFQGAGIEMIESGVIGGVVSVGINAIILGIQFKKGQISLEEYKQEVFTSGGISFISAGALGGLSLIFPPGLIGVGIGLAVSLPLRNAIASAFGKGSYEQMFLGIQSHEATVKSTISGVEMVYNSSKQTRDIQNGTINLLKKFATKARETNNKLDNWYE